MPEPKLSSTIDDSLPDPPTIRARLSDLAAEANLLRALLRLLECRECGRHVMRRRRAERLEASNA
jgi:hypothetical protein